MKKFLLFLLLLIFCACAKKIDITPKIADYHSKIAEADNLFKRGSYSCLKEAFALYQELLSFSDYQIKTKEKLIKTALLLAIREKELAILEATYFKKASELTQDFPNHLEFSLYLQIVDFLKVRGYGAVEDIIEDRLISNDYSAKLKKVEAWNSQLKEKAKTEEFLAYLFLSLNQSYYIKEKADFSHFLEIYPDSPLMTFIAAICQRENDELLEETIKKEPSFVEVYYFSGDNALEDRKLITAEKYFLESYIKIPESFSIVFSLARVYFLIGEIEKSLEFYNKGLKLAPKSRQALLGKAICLSSLGKYKEAMPVLDKLLFLGKWYLGDTHYWLAWNQNKLEQLEEAKENIEKSKLYLTEDSKVLNLAGIIAFKKDQFEEAEKNFKEALDLDNLSCQAFFYLGRIYSHKEDWIASGFYFEQAANCYEAAEEALRQKINEIESFALSEERKKRLILRKEQQLQETILSKATSYYNAAVCYFNAEFKDKTLIFAKKASLHPTYKEKAEELISKIRAEQKLIIYFIESIIYPFSCLLLNQQSDFFPQPYFFEVYPT